ncbi:MAG: Ig-like domain-containing protein, partial [Gemmatimonadales bacterium]
MTVTPDSVRVVAGTSVTFSAQARDPQGRLITGRPVKWSVMDAEVAAIDSATGVASAQAEGITKVRATVGVVSGDGTLVVSPIPVDSVLVTPEQAELRVGGSLVFTATLFDAAGSVLNGRAISWESTNPLVATVSPSTGLVTGAGLGTTTITATSEGVTGYAFVSVLPVAVDSVLVDPDSAELRTGDTRTFSATVLDSTGAVILGGRPISWSTADPSVATVNTTTGVLRGVGAGTTTVIATSEGVSDDAWVQVTDVPVSGVLISPDSVEIRVGGGTTFSAAVFDSTGTELSGRAVAWSSSDPGVASIDPVSGVAVGVGPGTVTVVAVSEGVGDSASLAVSQVPVDAVVITPASAFLRIGGRTTLAAAALDSAGGVLADRVPVWASLNPDVATVDPGTGEVTGIAVGSASITATIEGAADTAAVNVSELAVDSVAVVPDSTEIRVGGTTTFSASVFDSTGAPLTGRAVTWSTGDPAVASIDPSTGVVSGIGTGVTSVTATSEGVSGTGLVAVSPVRVDSLLVTPGVAEIRVGGSTQFSAAVFDSTGAPLSGRTVTWSIRDPAIATVDPATGVVTGLAEGATIVSATSEGVSDVAVVTVTRLPVASMLISPDSTEVRVGGQTTYTASVFDSTGAPLTGRTVTWSVSDPGLAITDPVTGSATAVTGLAPGRVILTAVSEGITDAALLGISPVPVDSVAVAPNRIEVRVGGQGTFAASVFDSTGAPLT